MTTTTYNLIAKQTVGSGGASSITFSNIPQTFTDLKVVASSRDDRSANGTDVYIGFNGSSANLTMRRLYGDGSSAYSSNGTTGNITIESSATATANTFGNAEVYIPNYAGSNNKSYSADGVSENNAGGAGSAFAQLTAGLWSITSAITSLTLTPSSGNFTEFSTFYLYGISNSSTQNTTTPSATGGDVITTDGTYWYHAFKYSGTFTPLKGLTADVLVVAGGGSGGGPHGGGGGAGGVLAFTSQTLAANTAQTVTIGGGGAGGAYTSNGTAGSNSTFGGLTASIGGGYGAGYPGTGPTGYVGGNGGSGGGGDGVSSSPLSGGSATSGQGYAGGAGSGNTSGGAGGGGGGSAHVGADGTNQGTYAQGGGLGGTGGDGDSTWSSWLSATSLGVSGYIAGGGGGGGYRSPSYSSAPAYGGAGGGGTGGYSDSSYNPIGVTAGTVNTGSGGGGGAGNGGTGAAGGSGLVIVRYAF